MKVWVVMKVGSSQPLSVYASLEAYSRQNSGCYPEKLSDTEYQVYNAHLNCDFILTEVPAFI